MNRTEWRRLQVLKSEAIRAARGFQVFDSTTMFDNERYFPIVKALDVGVLEQEIGITRAQLDRERRDRYLHEARCMVEWFRAGTVPQVVVKNSIAAAMRLGWVHNDIGVDNVEISCFKRVELLRNATHAVEHCRQGWAHFYDSIGHIRRAIRFGIPYAEFGTTKKEVKRFERQRAEKWAAV